MTNYHTQKQIYLVFLETRKCHKANKLLQILKVRRMTERLCDDNRFYNYICQVILLALYFNKHNKHITLKDLRNTPERCTMGLIFSAWKWNGDNTIHRGVDDALRSQSKSPLDDDIWKACTKILTDKGLIATWS